MADEVQDRIESIVASQRAVIRALHAASPSWLELNLTMAQLKTLIVLSDDGPLHIGQVGDRLGVTLPTASYQVERLVRAGLVERVEDARDRRRTLVHLTTKADELLRSLRQGRAGQLRSWLREMSPDDVRALDQGLSALASVASGQSGDEGQHAANARGVMVASGHDETSGDE